jgi:hypothetical protein
MKSLRLTILLILLLVGITSETSSQPVPQWINIFNGLLDSTDVGEDVVVDNAGNSYVTGSTYRLLNLLTDIYVTSYDPNGNIRWSAEYSSLLNDKPSAIILDNTQQYVYVVGHTNELLNITTLIADYVIIKYNASTGQQIWSRTYAGGLLTDDRATDIAMDSQNNPIITGHSESFLLFLSPSDYTTIKYNPAGTQQWVSRYNGTGNNEDRAYAIIVDGSDNVIVTGSSRSGNNDGTLDYATVKYNSNGTQQWASRYNGPGNNEDRAYAIIVDGSDNVIVTGESRNTSSANSEDYATIKYNSNGTQQWVSRYNGPGGNYDRAYAIIVDGSDNVIVTGDSRSTSSANSEDMATVKYNPSGTQQWASRYNGPGGNYDRAYAIIVDGSDNVYITGESRNGSGAGSEDMATLKYNSGGTQQWVVRHNGTGNHTDRAYAIIVDGSDNIFITGTSNNSALLGAEDIITIKYAPETNPVSVISTQVPVSNKLMQNYPNPFNPQTNIQFDIKNATNVKLAVYDILGNEVSLLANGRFNPGTYAVQWNAVNHPSGIYFYRLTFDGFTDTKKLILAK